MQGVYPCTKSLCSSWAFKNIISPQLNFLLLFCFTPFRSFLSEAYSKADLLFTSHYLGKTVFILLNKTISFYICNYICSRPFEIFLRHVWGFFCAQLSASRQASVQAVALNPKVFLLQQILVSPTLKKYSRKTKKPHTVFFIPVISIRGQRKNTGYWNGDIYL